MALQPDGKIVVGGGFTPPGRATAKLHRTAHGGWRTRRQLSNPGAEGGVNSLALQADGRILVGGSFTTIRPAVSLLPRPAQCRWDTGWFLQSGSQWRPFFLHLCRFPGRAIGRKDSGERQTSPLWEDNRESNIGRLNADGTLDGTFQPEVSTEVYSLAVQGDGKILVCGGLQPLWAGKQRKCIGRLNADGTTRTAPSMWGRWTVKLPSYPPWESRPDGKNRGGRRISARWVGRRVTTSPGLMRTAPWTPPSIRARTAMWFSLALQVDGKVSGGWLVFWRFGAGSARRYLARLNAGRDIGQRF